MKYLLSLLYNISNHGKGKFNEQTIKYLQEAAATAVPLVWMLVLKPIVSMELLQRLSLEGHFSGQHGIRLGKC